MLSTSTFKNNAAVQEQEARYNIFGELTQKGINGQYSTRVDYDAQGRIWRSNTEGHYQIFVYDLAGRLTQKVSSTSAYRPESQENGIDLSDSIYDNFERYDEHHWLYDLQREDYEYNAQGGLLKQSKAYAVTGANREKDVQLKHVTQEQSVDRWGNMLSFTNALKQRTEYEYNALNKLTTQRMPEVSIMDEHGLRTRIKPETTYVYDALGQSLAMTDANGHQVSKEYDATGRITKESDARGFARSKHYNLLNQQDTLTNERGIVTTYVYDAMNRLVSVSTPGTKQVYDYDEAGALIYQKNAAGEEQKFFYDTMGNQIKRVDARNKESLYEYDDAGHKIKETDAEHHSQTWRYNEKGQLEEHSDLGGHITNYRYNSNGLLVEEHSTAGKSTHYVYEGNGALIQFVDDTQKETLNYSYDEEGNLVAKESSRKDDAKGWIVEKDFYQYDELGRLTQVRRRTPEDKDTRFPDKDHALLSVDYDYDAVGNIRHTKVSANYTGFERLNHEEYFAYDDNNRMTINKGALVNDTIAITATQGSSIAYDEAGNISDSSQYDNKVLKKYHYQYNKDNQLELVELNKMALQAKTYDEAGRIKEERAFDVQGHLSQVSTMTYEHGQLMHQEVRNHDKAIQSMTDYGYDKVGNITSLSLMAQGITMTHEYGYALWDSYQQSTDSATQSNGTSSTYGKSTRIYDANGGLLESVDQQADSSGRSNSTKYWTSAVDGVKAREDQTGKTHYMSFAGKTIGDIKLDGFQHLNVYGGFSPNGNKTSDLTTSTFLDRTEQGTNGVVPESTQDNLGAYTVHAGDTLESIALQVYGDSSLWYLLADANGITNKNARAGDSDSLHIGQRINLPAVSSSQHQSNKTHKVLDASHFIGITAATTLAPAPPPPAERHNRLFAKIVVGIVATVATVLTAGAMGVMLGAVGSVSGSLFAIGTSVLGGGIIGGGALGVAGTLAAGFSAGFVGSIAGQGIANALELQDGISLKSALTSGLVTAVSAGLLKGLGEIPKYTAGLDKIKSLSPTKYFNTASATEMMEQNVVSQGLSTLINKEQHFAWDQFAVSGLTGGFMAGRAGEALSKKLKSLDFQTGLFNAELDDLTSAGAGALAGNKFDLKSALTNNLGNHLGKMVGHSQSGSDDLLYGDGLYLSDTMMSIAHPELFDGPLSSDDEGESFTSKISSFTDNVGSYLGSMIGGAKEALHEVGDSLFGEHGYLHPREYQQAAHEAAAREPVAVVKAAAKQVKEAKTSAHASSVKSAKKASESESSEDSDINNPSLLSIEDVRAAVNAKYKTKVAFEELTGYEGKQRPKGYLPIYTTGELKGEVIDDSGITFATGFDVGQLGKADLKRYAFPKDIEDKLLPFVDAKKEAARKLLPLAQKTVFSAQQLNLIDFKVKGYHLQRAIQSWDYRKQKDTPSFCDLSSAQQTVLLSRTFHQGPGMPTRPVSQKFYQAALKNNWVAAENHLRNYHVTAKYYQNRVHAEANLLKQERLSE